MKQPPELTFVKSCWSGLNTKHMPLRSKPVELVAALQQLRFWH
jgi:hypothetical protein